MIITITEIDNYLIKRNINHDWFDLSIEDKTELTYKAQDKVLYTYPLQNSLTEDNFSEQETEYQERIKLVMCKLIDFMLKDENEINFLRSNGITKFKDPISEIEINNTYEYKYRLGTLEIFNLLSPYIKPVNIQMR